MELLPLGEVLRELTSRESKLVMKEIEWNISKMNSLVNGKGNEEKQVWAVQHPVAILNIHLYKHISEDITWFCDKHEMDIHDSEAAVQKSLSLVAYLLMS